MPKDVWTLSTLNVNGLRSGVRRGFGPWLRRRRPDVLCLQESRLDSALELAGELAPPRRWRGEWNHAEKKGYSGVAVWSRERALEVRRDPLGWPISRRPRHHDGAPRRPRRGVYVPARAARAGVPGMPSRALPRVRAHALRTTDGVLRDLNIAHTELDIHNASANKRSSFLPHERAWMDALLAQGWVDVYRKVHPEGRAYSWWSNYGRARELDRGWRLDYQIATPDLADRAIAARIERKAGLSDHAPVTIAYRR
jgi:exodeoxyribonuclease-3